MSHPQLEFTGERMIPDSNHGAAFYYEHLARYIFAAQFCHKKTVLDVGSGAGYGSYLLATRGKAKRVIGVDQSAEAVEYASQRYTHPKSKYLELDATHLESIRSGSIEVSVCYEVVEHIDDQDTLLLEQKRVLSKDGILVISTPNKLTYPDGNEFHVKELYPDEFRALLKKYFKFVTFAYQGFELAQVMKVENENEDWILGENYSSAKSETLTPAGTEDNSQYLVAVCSDVPLPPIQPLLLTQNRVDFYDLSRGLLSLGEQYSELFQKAGSSNTQGPESTSNPDIDLLVLKEQRANLLLHLDRIRRSKFYKLWRGYVSVKEKIQRAIWSTLYRHWSLAAISNNGLIQGVKHFVPLQTRKKIAKVFSAFWPVRISRKIDVAADVKAEWRHWQTQRSAGSMDVIIFSVIGYDFRHQRPQHLAEQFVKAGHRVFYIENDFNLSRMKIQRKGKNLYSVTLPCFEKLFIYQDTPTRAHLNIWKDVSSELIFHAGMFNVLGKVDHPFWHPLVKELNIPYIYDCMDKHSGFAENSREILQYEQRLITEAQCILASSQVLYNDMRPLTESHIEILPNAGDFDHFSQAASTTQNPKKVVGYFGAIADWFDAELLEAALQRFPDVDFHLVGRVSNPAVAELEHNYENIRLFDEQSYQVLPQFLSQFDVCLIPFIVNDLILATSPVKMYEYLAAGKPVVTTALPETKEYSEILYYSDNSEAFLCNLEAALQEKPSRKLISQRRAVAQSNTWDVRGKKIQKLLQKLFFPKVSVVILSYNSVSLLQQCVESVQKRSFYPNHELIIVDNNSDEKTVQYLDSLKKSPRLKVIKNKKNMGFARGNNIGMEAATGEYIVLLNNDTIVTPGWISRLVHHIAPSEVGLVGPVTNSIGNEALVDIGVYDPHNTLSLERTARRYTALHWGETFGIRMLAAFCWIQKRSLYEELGGLDERFGQGMFEDDDYCRRVRESGRKILCAEDVFIHHFGSASFKKLASEKYRQLFERNKNLYEEKWGERWIPHTYRKES